MSFRERSDFFSLAARAPSIHGTQRKCDGYVEVLEGLSKGDEVVTSATFLIDAESNLKAALQAFTQQETAK